MKWRIHVGDALARLQDLPPGSARTCITSPPYWGLRDYGVEGQIGLESTPDAYVARIVEVFRAVRRVLADDGTLWLNLGDTYARGRVGRDDEGEEDLRRRYAEYGTGRPKAGRKGAANGQHRSAAGMKSKDLVGIPWRTAFALQADGWYLRSDIIWHKPNPMPESVEDRPTRAHEYLFLLSKSEHYFYDADAIREPLASKTFTTFGSTRRSKGSDGSGRIAADNWSKSVPIRKPRVDDNGNPVGGNKRSVWTIATRPFTEAHFATFPEELVLPCVLAGSAQGDTVLDPFAGAGTTGVVALKQHRSFVGIELNPEYCLMASARIGQVAPLFTRLERVP